VIPNVEVAGTTKQISLPAKYLRELRIASPSFSRALTCVTAAESEGVHRSAGLDLFLQGARGIEVEGGGRVVRFVERRGYVGEGSLRLDAADTSAPPLTRCAECRASRRLTAGGVTGGFPPAGVLPEPPLAAP